MASQVRMARDQGEERKGSTRGKKKKTGVMTMSREKKLEWLRNRID